MDGQASHSIPSPSFFYGYVVVFVSTIVMTLTFGVNYSFGIFFTPLRTEFGWTKAVTSVGYSVLTFIAGFLGIFAGRLTDRFSVRMGCIAGGIFLGLGRLYPHVPDCCGLAVLPYLCINRICRDWRCLALTYRHVPKWFIVRRGLMIGIVASGTGIGTMVVPPVASHLISVHGWRNAYVILGGFTVVFIVIAAMFMRRDPHQMGERLYGETRGEQEKDPEAPCQSETVLLSGQ